MSKSRQMIARVPVAEQAAFRAMLETLGIDEDQPSVLVGLLVRLGATPEGGEWLKTHAPPKISGTTVLWS